ncbi:hypothetical protein D3C71_1857670 [compost metagenome]
MGEDQGHARLAVALEFAIGQAQVIEHVQVDGIALGRSIQADQHDPAALFAADATAGALSHGRNPCTENVVQQGIAGQL